MTDGHRESAQSWSELLLDVKRRGLTIDPKYVGFGFFITEGLNQFFLTEVYVGAILSIVFAFAADAVLVRIERLVTPWARVRGEAG